MSAARDYAKLGASEQSMPEKRNDHFYVYVYVRDATRWEGQLCVRQIRPPQGLSPLLANHIMHPERWGISPREPGNFTVTIAQHVLGDTNDGRISVTEGCRPSVRFVRSQGYRTVYISPKELDRAGVSVVPNRAIVLDLERHAVQFPEERPIVDRMIRISSDIDRELMVNGSIPASAIRTGPALAATRTLQVLGGVAVLITVVDVGSSAYESIQTNSPKPILRSGVRNTTGWAGAALGAEVCAEVAGAAGLAAGGLPAIATGAVGGIVGGVIGFFAGDKALEWMGLNE